MLKLSGRIDPIQRTDTQSALLTITTDPFLPCPDSRPVCSADGSSESTLQVMGRQLISDGLERSESPLLIARNLSTAVSFQLFEKWRHCLH